MLGITEDKDEVKFGQLIQNIMEDAQARLVFRAQMYIHNDIQNYQPKPQDYEISVRSKQEEETEKNKKSVVLEEAPTTATLTIEEDTSDTHSIRSARSNLLADGSDDTCGWFPTLQKTLWILSKLYRCVQTGVFEDLAQEAVSLCNESLQKASETVTSLKVSLFSHTFVVFYIYSP